MKKHGRPPRQRTAAPVPEAAGSRWSARRLVLGILLVAAAVRIVYVIQIRDLPFFRTPIGDEVAYHKSAAAIAAGDVLAGKTVFYQDAFKRNPRWICTSSAGPRAWSR
jgi:hypothetical protein